MSRLIIMKGKKCHWLIPQTSYVTLDKFLFEYCQKFDPLVVFLIFLYKIIYNDVRNLV